MPGNPTRGRPRGTGKPIKLTDPMLERLARLRSQGRSILDIARSTRLDPKTVRVGLRRLEDDCTEDQCP